MGKSLKGKELGIGISQRKDGLYQGSFTDSFGKRRFVYGKTVREVSRKLEETKHDSKIGLSINPDDYTLDEWFDFWLKTYKKSCRNTSQLEYQSTYLYHVSGKLGNIKINKLNSLMIQNLIDEIPTDCVKSKVKNLLKDVFKWAKKLKIIDENYCDNVYVKRYKPKSKKRFLLDNEVEIIEKYIKTRVVYPFWVIGLNTGMRGGEIAGLKWGNIDFDNNLIHVKSTYVYKKSVNHDIVKEDHSPKTEKGIRDIPMTNKLREFLLTYKNDNKDNKVNSDDYVIQTKGNKPIPIVNVNGGFKLLVSTVNKKENTHIENFTSHVLRRTFATNAIKNGMNPKALQYILGHASYSTTMDIYCQTSEETIRNEMNVMNV